MKFAEHSEVDLKKIAMDIVDGHIFTDRSVDAGDGNILASIFMPIALGAFAEESKEYLEQIGMIYEYMSEAGPRSINSYPMFMSFAMLSKPQTKQVADFASAYIDMKSEMMKTSTVIHND